ncbi:MAG: M20/M25/M40 family metallo-hydrolase [Candidatus Helarchaeota archaeon]
MFTFTKDSDIGKETIDLLQNILQIDTTNPPGNEIEVANFLHDLFSKEGFDSEIYESDDGRGNIITKLKGSDPGAPKLLLLSHMDVVPANQMEWDVPPFSGQIKSNYIWGRGAIDCKNLVTTEAISLIKLKREGFKPKGDIIFCSTADEECGGNYGAKWVVENLWDKIKCDFVINEGGGIELPFGKTPKYLVQIAEKGVYWTKMRVKGVSAHASMPNIGDNALLKMLKVIYRIDTYKIPTVITEPFKEMVKSIGLPWIFEKLITSKRFAKGALKLAKLKFKQAVDIIIPLIQMTITPTVIETENKKTNIIPDSCEAVFDCRLLPGQDRDYLNKHLKKAIGKKLFSELELTPIQSDPGTVSPTNTILFEKISKTIKLLHPGAEIIPFMVAGFTDSKHFRVRGIPAYGCCPIRKDPDMELEEALTLGHGKNERISVNNLLLEGEFFYRLLKEF